VRDETVETSEENLTTNFPDLQSKGHTLSRLLLRAGVHLNPPLQASSYVIGVTKGSHSGRRLPPAEQALTKTPN
jgi:hypothetical protein